jgi:hypothetical protein
MLSSVYGNQTHFPEYYSRKREITYPGLALIDESTRTRAISNPSIFRRIRSFVGTFILIGLLSGCMQEQSANSTSIAQAAPTNPPVITTPTKTEATKYGCIGTIRTLSLNDLQTGELLTRMEDHTRVRINGEVTQEQDEMLDKNARTKERNPNADYNWLNISFVDKAGVIWNGGAASNWIDEVNPVDGGCNHAPGQNVHDGYGSAYEGK